MRTSLVSYLMAASVLVFVVCKGEPPPPAPTPVPKPKDVEIEAFRLQMYGALPPVMDSADNSLTEEKVELGRMLYYDKRLSKNHDISCNSCHDLQTFGVDNKPVSPGHKNQLGSRNSPTVYNAAGNFVQFWDGRAKSVEEQATQPIVNPIEMAMPDEKRVVTTLSSIPEYVDLFAKTFPDQKSPVTMNNVGVAIGAFERKLVTPSRWDKFLAGDKSALSNEEKTGFNKFMDSGCNACHIGVYAGGNMYQKLGLIAPWPGEGKDLGRFEVTKQETDKLMFKVPGLRNVEKTAPYLHDGSVESLEQVTKMMGSYQAGRDLSHEDVKSIVTWLKSLTGEIPSDYIKEPALPASTKKTPGPDPT